MKRSSMYNVYNISCSRIIFNAWVLFTIVFSSKLVLISYLGSDVPFWDQWDAEAYSLLLPWINDELTLSALFAPHNEHRIFFTRVLSIIAFELNGAWSPIFQAIINGFLSALTASILFLILARESHENWYRPALWILICSFYSIPFAWTNTVFGFQNQFHLMAIFSLTCIYFTTTRSMSQKMWWVGFLSGTLGLFTMSSGVLAAMACVVILTVSLIQSHFLKPGARKSETLMAILILVAIVIMGFSLLVTHEPHNVLKAKDIINFFAMFFKITSWPLTELPAYSFVLYIPLLLAFLIPLISRKHFEKQQLAVLTIGAWVVMQSAAMAYSRGALGEVSNRYADLLIIGIIVCFSAVHMISKTDLAKKHSSLFKVFAFTWILTLVCASFWTFSTKTIDMLKHEAFLAVKQQANVKNYLQTNNIDHLKNKPFKHVPYPQAERLAMILSHDEIKYSLVGKLTSGIELTQGSSSGFQSPGFFPFFVPSGYRSFGSYGKEGDSTVGWWRSNEISMQQDYFYLNVIGHLNEKGIKLSTISKSGEKKEVSTMMPPDKWTLIKIKNPGEPFVIELVDNSSKHWIAISQIFPDLPLYKHTLKLLKYAIHLLVIAIVLPLMLILGKLMWSKNIEYTNNR